MFYETFKILIEYPWLALIPVLIFYGLFQRWPFKLVLTTSILWLVYMFYELAIQFGLLCDEDCNIRVDLLVIYPFLGALSFLALLQVMWAAFRRKSG